MTNATQDKIYASTAKPWLKYYDKNAVEQPSPDCTAFEYICRQNKGRLGADALNYYDNKITYADFIVSVKKTAAALRGIGVKKGEIITVVSVMTPEVIYLFYAADMIGATLNLIDPRYSVEGIHDYIAEVDSHLLVCLAPVYERCHQAAKHTHVERVLIISPADSLPMLLKIGYQFKSPDKNRYASNVIKWKAFIEGGKGHSTAAEPYDEKHACAIVHTGGTTGSPKGVMLSDLNFNAIAQQFVLLNNLIHSGQKLMNIMPPFIAYGFACGVHLPLVAGITVIIIPQLDPAKLGSLVLKYKPENMFGVPAHYQQLAADPRMKNKDLSFIANYGAGGDSFSLGAENSVNSFLKEHNAKYPVAKGYGMTEVNSSATAAFGLNNKPGSVGIPMIHTVISVFEPGTEEELPIGERGELCISTPCAMLGYYNKPEETAIIMRTHKDGRVWVHTGDIGYMDNDGFVYIDSRIKRLIIRHDGFKVFPSMIENVISQHPAILRCSAVGCTDKAHVQGRLPFVYLVLDPAAGTKKKQVIRELRQMCREQLPEYVQPVAYKFIAEMPFTPIGKIDYRKLEQEITPRDY